MRWDAIIRRPCQTKNNPDSNLSAKPVRYSVFLWKVRTVPCYPPLPTPRNYIRSSSSYGNATRPFVIKGFLDLINGAFRATGSRLTSARTIYVYDWGKKDGNAFPRYADDGIISSWTRTVNILSIRETVSYTTRPAGRCRILSREKRRSQQSSPIL